MAVTPSAIIMVRRYDQRVRNNDCSATPSSVSSIRSPRPSVILQTTPGGGSVYQPARSISVLHALAPDDFDERQGDHFEIERQRTMAEIVAVECHLDRDR